MHKFLQTYAQHLHFVYIFSRLIFIDNSISVLPAPGLHSDAKVGTSVRKRLRQRGGSRARGSSQPSPCVGCGPPAGPSYRWRRCPPRSQRRQQPLQWGFAHDAVRRIPQGRGIAIRDTIIIIVIIVIIISIIIVIIIIIIIIIIIVSIIIIIVIIIIIIIIITTR